MEDMAARARGVPLTRDATLIVLAGGRSTRMGSDKATLRVGEGTLVEWVVRRLGPSFAEALVCGGSATGARGIPDRRAAAGPLAGIEAGLLAMRTEAAFVLACDMPWVSERLATAVLGRLEGRDVVMPRVGDMDQPACAAYARRVAPRLTGYLDGGGRRVSAFLATLDVLRVDERALSDAGVSLEELADLDTPEAYDAFVASLRSARD